MAYPPPPPPPPPGAALSEFPSPQMRMRHRALVLPHEIYSQEITASHTYNYPANFFHPANVFLPHEFIMLMDAEETTRHRVHQAGDNDDDGEVALIFALPVQSGAHEDMMATMSEEGDDGLPEEVIARFLKTSAVCEKAAAEEDDDPKLCAVCQDNLYQEDRTVGILGCNHDFHADCIGKWLQIKNICPLCKDIAIKIIY